mgnify:CR=1 FL=1
MLRLFLCVKTNSNLNIVLFFLGVTFILFLIQDKGRVIRYKFWLKAQARQKLSTTTANAIPKDIVFIKNKDHQNIRHKKSASLNEALTFYLETKN